MRLSEFKGDEALDVLAELCEPVLELCADEEIKNAFTGKMPKVKIIKPLIKNHKQAIKHILATLDCKPVEDYEINLLTLPIKILEVLNDPEITSLFTFSQTEKGLRS